MGVLVPEVAFVPLVEEATVPIVNREPVPIYLMGAADFPIISYKTADKEKVQSDVRVFQKNGRIPL